jgi:hypothetical protein
MHGLLRLGPSGPFPRDSQPAWFFHGDGFTRVMDVPGYKVALVELGMAEHAARDLVGRMHAQGAIGVLWAGAQGGERGHIRVAWDVRVAITTSPASEAVPAITGTLGRPVGAGAVPSLETRHGVLATYTHGMQPQKIRLPSAQGPRWSRALGLPAQIHYHFSRVAYAALAVENVGATVNVYASSLPAAEHAMRSLVDIVLQDIKS